MICLENKIKFQVDLWRSNWWSLWWVFHCWEQISSKGISFLILNHDYQVCLNGVNSFNILQESLTHDNDARYWSQRYSLKEGIPSFLVNIAGTILTTGKYLNVMRECGHHVQVFYIYHYNVLLFPCGEIGGISSSLCWSLDIFGQVPVSENSKLMSFGTNHHYLECIKSAYGFASSELLTLIKEKVRCILSPVDFHAYSINFFGFVWRTCVPVIFLLRNWLRAVVRILQLILHSSCSMIWWESCDL